MFAPCALREEFEFELRLASNEEILVGDGGSYELTGLRLQYEIIENQHLVDQVVNLYDGEHTIMFEDVMFFQQEVWSANSTLQNIHINPTRQSLRAIVCLFKMDTENTENFEYPNIECVNIRSDGMAGALYVINSPLEIYSFAGSQWDCILSVFNIYFNNHLHLHI